MAKQAVKYKFNAETLSYEPVKSKHSERIKTVIVHGIIGAFLGFAAFLAYTNIFDSPDMRKLKEENERMAIQYEILLRQSKELEEILSDLEDRDNNMYRAIMQAEPIEKSNRQGNLSQSNRYADMITMSHGALVINTTKELDLLARRLYIQSRSYDELVEMVRNNEDRLRHLPAIQPVKNKEMKRESSGFGWRTDPIYNTRKFHHGLDFSVPVGTDVYATADGKVAHVAYERGGYGYVIRIDHGYHYETVYAHLKNTKKVKLGQQVKRGDIIAESGHTGKSTAPHLHYEVRYKGKTENPIYYFFKDLTPEEYDDMLQNLSNSGMTMD